MVWRKASRSALSGAGSMRFDAEGLRAVGRARPKGRPAGASTFPVATADHGSRKVIIKTTFNGYALWRTDHTKLGRRLPLASRVFRT
jgi:hypothetical protein